LQNITGLHDKRLERQVTKHDWELRVNNIHKVFLSKNLKQTRRFENLSIESKKILKFLSKEDVPT